MAAEATPSRPTHRPPSREWEAHVWTVALAAPVILAVVPGMTRITADAFEAFAEAPLWYQAGVSTAILFAFGGRAVRGVRSLHLTSPRSPAPSTPALAAS